MVDFKTGQPQNSSFKSFKRWSLAIVSVMTVGLGSCATNAPNSGTPAESPQAQASPEATTAELQVVTTFLPITQFTRAVAGDRAEVTQLLPVNVGPHDYQAKPDDAQTLARANVLVKNGLEMETFLDDLVANAGNSNLKVIDSSDGVKTITTESIEGESHDHDHGGEEKANGHDHGEFNPHIWLDPKRAIQQVENIRDGLIAADPAGKAIYTANAATYIQQLQDLDSETANLLQPFTGKTFIVLHDFAPYFADSYNLKASYLVDIPEDNPSPEDVKRVMNTVKDSNLKTLLTEPQSGSSSFEALANDLKVRVSTFDPMETGAADAQPEDYLTTMRQNVKTLVNAFTGSSPQSMLPLSVVQPVAWIPQRLGSL